MKKFALLIVLAVLLVSGVNADVGTYVNYKDTEERHLDVEEDKVIGFNVGVLSDEGQFIVDHVSLRDMNDNPLHYYIGENDEDLIVYGSEYDSDFSVSGLAPGNYRIIAVAEGVSGAINSDEVTLTVLKKVQPPQPPVNNAPSFVIKDKDGKDISNAVIIFVEDEEEVVLDLSGSFDKDKDVLSYSVVINTEKPLNYTLPIIAGEPISRLLSFTADIDAMEYIVSLTLGDGKGGITTKSIKVVVNPKSENALPILVIKANGEIVESTDELVLGYDEKLSFDLSESSDLDEDVLVYGWGFESGYDVFTPIDQDLEIDVNNPFLEVGSFNTITFTIQDGNGGSATQEVRFKFKPEAFEPQSDVIMGDVNKDGKVDFSDFLDLTSAFDTQEGDERFNPNADLDGDGDVDFEDFLIFSKDFGRDSGLSLKFLDSIGEEISEGRIKENQAYSFQVEARDKDGKKLDFDVRSELTVSKNLEIYATASTDFESVEHPNTEKVHGVVVSATDGVNVIEKVFLLNVEDVNRAPVISEIEKIEPKFSPKEGQVVKLEVKFEDLDGDQLSYEVSGGNFVQEGNILIWETGFEDAGRQEINVIGRDGFGGESSGEIVFRIAQNEPILFTSEPVTDFVIETVGEEYRYDVDTNREARGLTNFPVYSLEGPKGMNIDEKSGLVTWIPDSNDVGEYDVTIFVKDEDGLEADQGFELEVRLPGNEAPSLSVKKNGEEVSEVSIKENEELKFQIEVVDPDGDLYPGSVSVELENEETWMKIENGELVFDLVGNYDVIQHPATEKEFEFKVVASDGMDEREVEFKVNVRDVNRLPNLSVPEERIVVEEGNLEGDVGNSVRFDVLKETDPDGDEVFLSVENLPKGARLKDGEFIWKLRRNQGNPEDYEIRFTLVDSLGKIEEKVVNINVEDITSPTYPDFFKEFSRPKATLGVLGEITEVEGGFEVLFSAANSRDNQNFGEDLEYRYDWDTDGKYDTDWSKDLTGSKSRRSHIFSKDLDSVVVVLEVRDGDLDKDQSAVRVDFEKGTTGPGPEPSNQAPTITSIPGETVIAGQSFSTINLDSFVSDDKTSDANIVWNFVSTQLSVSKDVVENDQIATITYPNGFLGSETITFTATDEDGGSTSVNVDFAVQTAGPNTVPTLAVQKNGAGVTTVSVKEGENLTLTLVGNDADGDALKYEGSNLPSGSDLTGSVFTWTPNNIQGGKSYVVTFRALDLDSVGGLKGGSASQAVVITVEDSLEPKFKRDKRKNHNLDIKNVIVNNWENVRKGESFDIDVMIRNKGNVKEKDVRVSVEIPQLDYYDRSSDFDVKKRRDERRSFAAVMPSDFEDDMVFAIVTASSDHDEETVVMGFLVE